MGALIARRLAAGVGVLLAVSLLVFVATLLLPGDPAQAVLGQQATPERVAALREQMGLDEPAWLRYLGWLGGLVTGDLGVSAATGEPVSELLGERIGASLLLMVLASALSVPVGVALGCWVAWRRGRAVDHVATGITLVLAALPEFVVGLGLIVALSTTVLPVLPSVTLAPPGEPVWFYPAQLVLPVLTLVLVVTPYITRMMRATMSEVLDSGHVEMARLKGVPERQVLWRHAVPHALAPVAQVVAVQLAWLAGGIVVVEFLFRYPGVGQALVDAVANRDVLVVQAVAMLVAAVYLVVNLAADLVGIVTDPRVRTGAGR